MNQQTQAALMDKLTAIQEQLVELKELSAIQESWARVEQAKQEWEATADTLSELICLLDEQQQVIRANRTIEGWGLGSVVQVRGKSAHQLLHPDCEGEQCPLQTWLQQGWQVLWAGQSSEHEFYDGYLERYLHGRMQRIQVDTHAMKSRLSSFAVLVIRDVSLQKQLDKELGQYRNHLEQLVRDRTRQLEVIALLSERLNIIIDFDQLLIELVHQIKDNFGYYQVQVYILDVGHDQLVMKAGQSDDVAWLPEQTIALEDELSLVAQAARTSEVIIINQGQEQMGYAEMAVPIVAISEVLGVLDVREYKIGRFDENDANMLRSLAGQVAISLENAKLYEGMNALYVELRESEAKFREVVEGTDNLIIQINPTGYITYVNHVAHTIFGLTPSNCVGVLAVDFTHPDDRERTDQLLSDCLQRRASTTTFENRQVNRVTGEVFYLFWNVTFHYGKTGQLAAINAITHDITERKQMEAAMQKANEELSHLNADKDKFFSIVAHDLKGPFQPLLGHAELLMELADTLPPSEVKAMSAAIHRSGRQILSLLENLLQWSRLQMGRIEYAPQSIDLAVLVAGTIELLSETAKKKGVSLQSTVPAPIWVYADSNMLDTVIRNLTNNALKFTPDLGHVTITARLISPAEVNREWVEVAVIDTGVGMSPENKAKLFQTGVHHSTVGTANEKGTGLGLILCKEMVERNGGQIWVESELGQGTTVKFTVLKGAE